MLLGEWYSVRNEVFDDGSNWVWRSWRRLFLLRPIPGFNSKAVFEFLLSRGGNRQVTVAANCNLAVLLELNEFSKRAALVIERIHMVPKELNRHCLDFFSKQACSIFLIVIKFELRRCLRVSTVSEAKPHPRV